MTAPKKIIFYHNCFAIPADIWLFPEAEPLDIILKQVMAFDLPKEMNFKVLDKRFLHFPEFFYKHLDTLRSIVEAIRHLGVPIFLRLDRKN
jgi:hypothetical protein